MKVNTTTARPLVALAPLSTTRARTPAKSGLAASVDNILPAQDARPGGPKPARASGSLLGRLWGCFKKCLASLVTSVTTAVVTALVAGARAVPAGLSATARALVGATRALAFGVAGLARAVVGVPRAIAFGLGAMARGLGRLFTGDFVGAGRAMWKGLLHMASPVVMGTLQGVSAVQTALGLEKPGRKLTAQETIELRRVFGPAVDLGKVRVKEGGSGLLTAFSPRPFCMGNTIYIPRPDKSPRQRLSTLVHEMVHVWQFQNGGTTYVSSSIHGQTAGAGYDFASGVREGLPFDAMGAEQQAQMIQTAFDYGCFGEGGRVGWFRDESGLDCTEYLREAMARVRIGLGAP